jgi:hypothetical protein
VQFTVQPIKIFLLTLRHPNDSRNLARTIYLMVRSDFVA